MFENLYMTLQVALKKTFGFLMISGDLERETGMKWVEQGLSLSGGNQLIDL